MSGAVKVEDRLAIHDLLMAYVWASDTGDYEGYARTFTPDGLLVTSDGDPFRGREAIEGYARTFFALPGSRGRMHFFQQMSIKPEGGGYRVFSFWMVVQVSVEDNTQRLRSTGTTDDLCLKIGDEWLLAERKIGRWNSKTAPWVGAV